MFLDSKKRGEDKGIKIIYIPIYSQYQIIMFFAHDVMVMRSKTFQKGMRFQSMGETSSYHLCPKCFPNRDLNCEICEGHGRYLIIESEKNT